MRSRHEIGEARLVPNGRPATPVGGWKTADNLSGVRKPAYLAGFGLQPVIGWTQRMAGGVHQTAAGSRRETGSWYRETGGRGAETGLQLREPSRVRGVIGTHQDWVAGSSGVLRGRPLPPPSPHRSKQRRGREPEVLRLLRRPLRTAQSSGAGVSRKCGNCCADSNVLGVSRNPRNAPRQTIQR